MKIPVLDKWPRIPNPGIPSYIPLGGSNVDVALHYPTGDQMST